MEAGAAAGAVAAEEAAEEAAGEAAEEAAESGALKISLATKSDHAVRSTSNWVFSRLCLQLDAVQCNNIFPPEAGRTAHFIHHVDP